MLVITITDFVVQRAKLSLRLTKKIPKFKKDVFQESWPKTLYVLSKWTKPNCSACT